MTPSLTKLDCIDEEGGMGEKSIDELPQYSENGHLQKMGNLK